MEGTLVLAVIVGLAAGLPWTLANGVWELLLARQTRRVVLARVDAAEQEARDGRARIHQHVDTIREELVELVNARVRELGERVDAGGSARVAKAREELEAMRAELAAQSEALEERASAAEAELAKREEEANARLSAARDALAQREEALEERAAAMQEELAQRAGKNFSDPAKAAEAGRLGAASRAAAEIAREAADSRLRAALGPVVASMIEERFPDKWQKALKHPEAAQTILGPIVGWIRKQFPKLDLSGAGGSPEALVSFANAASASDGSIPDVGWGP